MDSNFQKSLAFTLQQEGGFADNPYDHGGATNYGITLATLIHYMPHATIEDLKEIKPDVVSHIYSLGYWVPSGAASLPPGVDLSVFDMAVNAGPVQSIKLLQGVLSVTIDGQFGPVTRAAVAKQPPLDIILGLGFVQYWYYRNIPTWAEFGRGWSARIIAREDAAITMAKANIATPQESTS